MPTYDYICLSCGENHEIFHSMKETTSRKCPTCKEGILEKQLSTGAGIIFKGTGFYATDYKKSSPTTSSSENTNTPAGGCNHNSTCSCGK